MTDLQNGAYHDGALDAHQVTFDEFSRRAHVEELQNHGRKWRVTYDDGNEATKFETFTDAPSISEAITDAHTIAVNNALYLIEQEKGAGRLSTPRMPPAAVLQEYPELVAKFGIDMKQLDAVVESTYQGLAQRQLDRAALLGSDAFLQGRGSEPTDSSELVELIARRAGNEHAPHEATTSDLVKAYTSAWLEAEQRQAVEFKAIDSMIAVTCADEAAAHLRAGNYRAALGELKSGEQEAVRPTDQGTFAGMASVLERELTPGDNLTLDPATRDHLIADIEQLRTDMKTWIDESLSHTKSEPALTNPLRDTEPRVLGDTEMLVIRLREADERVRQMETGSTPRYSASERVEVSQLAIAAMHPERLRSAVDGATSGADNFNTARVVARNIANTMATVDGPDAANPFTGTTLENVYSSAQRWNAYITRRGDSETLQQLLNMRSTLVDYVEISSMALYEAQQHESRLFVRAKKEGQGLSSETASEHHRSVQTVKDATLSFKSALDDLRQFRNHPTDQPQLRSAFQEVESLELVIAKTERSIEAAKDSGLGINEQDRRELREVQTMLKAFLQQHDATIPLQSEALLSTVRDSDAHKVAPQQAVR